MLIIAGDCIEPVHAALIRVITPLSLASMIFKKIAENCGKCRANFSFTSYSRGKKEKQNRKGCEHLSFEDKK